MRHGHTVLFVDDEVNILKALQRLLRAEDMNVLCASRASEALELLENHPTQVVVTDQRMPEMAGVDLLAHVRERQPDIVRMMLTGYTEMKVAVDAINRGEIYRLITKPWNDDELRATLRQAFDHADLKAEIKRLNQVTREQNFKLQDMNHNLEGKLRDRTKQLAQKCEGLPHGWVAGSGRGSPDRLRGDLIPLPSRIHHVADTVEAMTSDRPYRKALTLEAVGAEIHKYTGSQFDPNVTGPFLRLIERE